MINFLPKLEGRLPPLSRCSRVTGSWSGALQGVECGVIQSAAAQRARFAAAPETERRAIALKRKSSPGRHIPELYYTSGTRVPGGIFPNSITRVVPAFPAQSPANRRRDSTLYGSVCETIEL